MITHKSHTFKLHLVGLWTVGKARVSDRMHFGINVCLKCDYCPNSSYSAAVVFFKSRLMEVILAHDVLKQTLCTPTHLFVFLQAVFSLLFPLHTSVALTVSFIQQLRSFHTLECGEGGLEQTCPQSGVAENTAVLLSVPDRFTLRPRCRALIFLRPWCFFSPPRWVNTSETAPRPLWNPSRLAAPMKFLLDPAGS